jgi:two-component system chemotaxis response regulator CheY
MSTRSTYPTILIVDDEPLIRSWIRTALVNLECQVLEEEADGKQAVHRYRKLQPDITFLDIDMPGKNGLDTLEEILAGNPDAFVVMVSGHSTFENVQLAIERGARGFIVKPFSIKKFQMLINKFMDVEATA